MRVKNWFGERRKRNFKFAFRSLKNRPASYLEIGVFRGASIAWMLEHILTHEDSHAIGVDPWEAERMGRPWRQYECDENKALAEQAVAPFGSKCSLYRQPSDSWFAVCGPALVGGLDAIYLDGMHDYEPLKADFIAAWPLLKVGGVLVIDDYNARRSEIPQVIADLTPEYGSLWEELFRNYQIGFRRLA